MVAVVVGDLAERAAHMADDRVLSAVVDGVVDDLVAADHAFGPADAQSLEHGFELILVAGLAFGAVPLVVSGGGLLAQTDRRAFGVMQDVVADGPSARPVGADHADLRGRRRRPRRGGLRHLESDDADVVDVGARGEEAAAAHVDLDRLGVGVGSLEVGPDGGGFGAFVDLAVPHVARLVGVVHRAGDLQRVVGQRRADLRVVELGGVGDLVERPAVEVDVTQMLRRVGVAVRRVQPVAEDRFAVRVERAEERVGQRHLPHIAAIAFPGGDAFGFLDDGALPLGRAIGDAFQIADAAVGGINLFAVDALVHDDGVPRAGQFGGLRNRGERVREVARRQIVAIGTDVELESHDAATPLSLAFGNPAAPARPPIIQRYTAFRCLVWVSGSGGGGAGRVVWGYGYHVVVHRRPATA